MNFEDVDIDKIDVNKIDIDNCNVFSISLRDFFDKNKVKVFHGVAGRGKSSVINSVLMIFKILFLWTTSTNKLKRDAQKRYNCRASTVCSALFENKNGIFYGNFKYPDVDTIIIDEILQTNKKVFEWIRQNVGKYNIIVMTDKKQMLVVDEKSTGTAILREFEEFLKEDFVLSDEGMETKRARDAETKAKIEYLYQHSDESATEFKADVDTNRFDIISYDDMIYDTNNIYITHKNETEEKLYLDMKFAMRQWNEDELIPKGSLASRPPKDLSKYPVMSQSQAERIKATRYCQVANVGSATRYQGSECRSDQKLYYIITQGSRITNREWYTVVSRCWNLDSIVIVIAPNVTHKKLDNFAGKKIKESKILTVYTRTGA